MTVFQKKMNYFALKQEEYLRHFYSRVGRNREDREGRDNSLNQMA